MSAYRQNHTPAPAQPVSTSRRGRWALAGAIVLCAIAWAFAQHIAALQAAEDAQVQLTLVAFRAGYQAAEQTGCRTALLSMPLPAAQVQ